MKHLAITALGAVTIPAILYVFYSAVRTQWPNSYVSASKDVGLVINRSVCRYIVFLVVPTYAVALIVSTTVARFHGSALVCAIVGAAIHVGRTQVAHYFRTIRAIENHTKVPATIVVASAAIATFASAAAASFGPGPFPAVVPPVDEFFKSLWTTILVALLAVFAVQRWGDTTSATALARRSRREVGDDLISFARAHALDCDADPTLVEGVLLAENLQRPYWVRRLERWKGKVSHEGTYGVMQVRSNKPLSDKESIKKAISEFFTGVTISREEYGTYNRQELRRFLRRYNPDDNFVEVAENMIDEIYIPIESAPESAASVPNQRRREEIIEERVALATKIFVAMASRAMSPKEGLVSIASLPMRDLRRLVELVERLPDFETPESAEMKRHAEVALADAPDPPQES